MKCFLRLFVFILLCSGAFFHAAAQSNTMGWFASFNTIKLKDKWSLHTDVQFRSTDKFEHMNQILLRPGINYQLNKKMIVSAGYAYTHQRAAAAGITGYVPDHRIWQQFIYNQKLSQLAIQHRFRLEERFVPKPVVVNNKIENDGSLYTTRLRYFIRNILPLKQQPVFTKGAFVALQNEVFVNISNKKNVNGKFFDQNRLYPAIGYRFSKKFDIDAGYMYQYVKGKGSASANNNIIQLATYLRL